MTTMLERVARAIYEDRNGARCIPWSRQGAVYRAPYLSDARAALRAMRDPSDEMMVSLGKMCQQVGRAPTLNEGWKTMIEAALSEGPHDAG